MPQGKACVHVGKEGRTPEKTGGYAFFFCAKNGCAGTELMGRIALSIY